MTAKPKALCSKCGRFPKVKGSNKFCYWCALSRLPMTTQIEVAEWRRQRATGPQRDRVPASQWPLGARWCAGCQSFIPLEYCSGSRCRACVSRAAHVSSMRREFFIEPEEYDALIAFQGGACAICLQKPVSRRLALDHSHYTGAKRGLLCSRCNNELLVLVNHDPAMLRRAAEYLEDPPWDRMRRDK